MRACSQMEWLVDGCIGRKPVTEVLRSKIEVGTADLRGACSQTRRFVEACIGRKPVTEVLRSKIEVGTAKHVNEMERT